MEIGNRNITNQFLSTLWESVHFCTITIKQRPGGDTFSFRKILLASIQIKINNYAVQIL